MGVSNATDPDRHEEVEKRLIDAHDRAYPNDTGWIDRSYPRTVSIEESQILTAEEVKAAEEELLGKRGVPHDDKCSAGLFEGGLCSCSAGQAELNDEVPNFLHVAAKAGPVLDALGRTPKERKPMDAAALGETENLPVIINPSKPKRTTTILRDHDLEYPDLFLAVYVAPDWDVPEDEARFARLFVRSGCYRADSIEEADLVVFGGGSDVEPLLYGESNEHRHPTVFYNPKRDAADMEIYLKARAQGTPMMGVCRGAQFLHVMNGGKLFQHVDGHNGAHKAFAMRDKMLIESVSSVHHQACVFDPSLGMELLLTTGSVSTNRWLNADEKDLKPKMDIEGFFYRDSGCFGVQGHPEYANYNKFSVWCLEQIGSLFVNSQDFCWYDKRLQMTPEARDAKEIATQYVENAYKQSKEA
jgi:hypothetical protein